MTKLLRVQELCYKHEVKTRLFAKPRTFELGPISFDIGWGETIAVIGNNGSGKTLLAKMLANAIKADSGQIEFFEESDKSDSPSTRHPVRLVLQHDVNGMNSAISVGSILHNTLKLNTELDHQQRQQKIEGVLRTVGLQPDHYYHYRHMLSDGQQQRVAMARALLLDPKIIVADEPFAALDPSVRSQAVNLILSLQKRLGLGFIFISHNVGIVRHISDKVLVMDKGKIIEQGYTQQVFEHPQHSVTQKLLNAHQNLAKRHHSQKSEA